MGGTYCADIGKYSLDLSYPDSDQSEFTKKMCNNALISNTAGKNFASGWNDHYIQDTYGSIQNISGGPSTYRIKSGWIDEYLRDGKTPSVISPLSGASLYINYSLIKKVYSDCGYFLMTDADVTSNIDCMNALYHAAILANTQTWTSAQKSSIENELTRTRNLCRGLTSYMYPLKTSTSASSLLSTSTVGPASFSAEDIAKKLQSNKQAKDLFKHSVKEHTRSTVDYSRSNTNDTEGIYHWSIDDLNEFDKELAPILEMLN